MSARKSSVRTTRSLVAIAAATLALGIGFAAAKGPDFGGVVAFAGALLFTYALHRFGRSGPDGGA